MTTAKLHHIYTYSCTNPRVPGNIRDIETIYNKGTGKMNADALLFSVSNALFGVFDGATGLEPFLSKDGRTGAAIASSLACDAFWEGGKSLVELARDANVTIKNAMREEGIESTRKTALWATTAAVVRFSNKIFEWVQIGDSLILVILKDGSFRLLAEDYNHDLETMIMWRKLADQKMENIGNILKEQILDVRQRMNVVYGCLDGEEEMERFLRSGFFTLDEVAHILLFTDGLFIPTEDPQKGGDFKTLVELFLEDGLKHVYTYVRREESSDPHCWRYPRYTQHDDIAAIAFSF